MQTVGEAGFESKVLKAEGVVLVDFCADWCDSCRYQEPALESIAEEYEIEGGDSRITFVKVNIEKNSNLVAEYRVIHIPTLFLFKEGKPIHRVIGFEWEDDLRKVLETVQV